MNKIFQAIGVIILAFMMTGCDDEKLLSNLTQNQANQVIATLQQHNIMAKKEGSLKSGYNISVNGAESTAALSVINQYQLPWSADVEIAQAFPEGGLVDSPNAEQARVLSLQEQRLEQSMRLILQVVNARVHVSYPSFTPDIDNRKQIEHVSVLITYKGDLDDVIFISQIKSLIKNSFDDIRYENISVVLFPAPPLQYAPPGNVQNKNTSILGLLVMIALLLILTITGITYYNIKLKPARKNAGPELIEEPSEK